METVDRCLASVQLDDAVVAWLTDRPNAAHEVRPQPRCDLQFGHDGPHAALGQQVNDVEWWVRWTLVGSEIFQITMCPACSETLRDSDGEPERCLLYDGHAGGHSYEFDHP